MRRPFYQLLWIALFVTSCVDQAAPLEDHALDVTSDVEDDVAAPVADVCTTGENRCDAVVRMTASGRIRAAAVPRGLGPADLKSAYSIPPAKAAATIAIVDAFGYAAVESDLAAYRTQYNLPPCTRANGCLVVVNEAGQASPLPAEPPPTDDWTLESALDVQMASAVCPTCRIILVQATDNGLSLYRSQNAAAALGATVISNSWGGPENAAKIALEPNFDHPGIAIFVSAGDKGYNEGGTGPHYPSVSSHVISVGGTRLVRDGSARGWSEVAWSLNKGAAAGSSCSAMVAKPAYQTGVPCTFKAATDISAVADPATGVAVYNARNGGWLVLGGTSAAAPIVASIFAVTGHGADASGPYIAQHTAKLYDIKIGTNGGCGTSVCNSGVGWDGPTGYGTPNATLLAGGDAPGLAITSPANGAHVAAGFPITADVVNATSVQLSIDGAGAGSAVQAPFTFAAPATLASGSHTIELTATAITGATKQVSITVVVDEPKHDGGGGGSSGSGGDDPAGTSGGCAASGGHSSAWAGIAIAFLIVRRRPRSRPRPRASA
jgi:subtilase family serine protease